jgi:hypothetical protein
MPERWWAETLKKSQGIERELADLPSILEKAIKLEKEYTSAKPFQNIEYKLPYSLLKIFKKDIYFAQEPLSKLIKEFLEAVEVENIDARTVSGYLKRVGQFYSNLSGLKAFYREYRRDFEQEYDYLLDELDDSKDDIPDYSNVLETFTRAEKLIDTLVEYVRFSSNVNDKVEAWLERMSISAKKYYGGEDSKPKHSKFETLYHATPYVSEILQSGFKTKSELGNQQSLGGSTQFSDKDWRKEALSFTGDIQIARAIAKSLVEVIKISKGQMKLRDVIRMFKGETPDTDKFGDAFRSRVSNWMMDYRHDPSGSPSQVFDLYKRFLGTTKLRYNPLFFGVSIEDFNSLDEKNVGVIAAVVQMDKVGKYLPAMEEFRVPKEAILKIKRV